MDFMVLSLEAGEPADQEARERQDFEIRLREQQAKDHARLAHLARPMASRVATAVQPPSYLTTWTQNFSSPFP